MDSQQPTLIDALVESWDRQTRIVDSLGSLVTPQNQWFKPSEDGWPIGEHLAHIHLVRTFWLGQLDAEVAATMPSLFSKGWEGPTDDLDAIRSALKQSALAIHHTMAKALGENRQKCGGYDHPVMFLQHMVWHEGWHVGLIMLALRLKGQEPSEQWQEQHVWGEWRTEE